jgi:hypothetical protein
MPTLEEVLRQMGDTPDAVAETLRQAGIKMVRDDQALRCKTCPVATYLRRHGFPLAVVYTDIALPNDVVSMDERVDMPPAVVQFVHDFDNGRYSDLYA